jgi:hypothetical protein
MHGGGHVAGFHAGKRVAAPTKAAPRPEPGMSISTLALVLPRASRASATPP